MKKAIEDLQKKDAKELREALKEAKNEVVSLRLEMAQGKLKNTRAIFEKRKTIAQIATIIRQKELANEKNI